MYLPLTILWLAIAGPLAALVLAQLTGGMTWSRVILWTIACQLVLALLYVVTQPMPLRIYGEQRPTPVDIWVGKAQFALVIAVIGVVVAALMTPVGRWLVRG